MAKGLGFAAMKSNRRPRGKGLAETQGPLPACVRHLCARHCEQKRWAEEAAGGGALGGFGGRQELFQQDPPPSLALKEGQR